jgi:hypothetical protein
MRLMPKQHVPPAHSTIEEFVKRICRSWENEDGSLGTNHMYYRELMAFVKALTALYADYLNSQTYDDAC